MSALAQPRLRVFAGPNGSGKSTIYDMLRPEWLGVYVNADEIEKTLQRSGTLDLTPFELSASPAALQERLQSWLRASLFLQSHGLAGMADHLAIDAFLLPGQ